MAFASFLLGAMWLVALRAALNQNDAVHYHANFGLFIDGKQDMFDNFTYYEEVQVCRVVDEKNAENPKARAHLHQPNNHAVHVHDRAVTWSDFFVNLGYGLSNKSIATRDAVYVDGQDGKKLTFLLNGQPVTTIADKVIGNEDMLLISYGADDQKTLQAQSDKIPKDAETVNSGTDPAGCGGAEKLSLSSRIKHAFNLAE